MRRILLCLGVLLMTLGCVHAKNTVSQPAGAPPPALFSGDGPHVVRLKNGLTVLIKRDDRFPLANVRLYVRTGSAYETPNQAGISHLLEHMVFKGTEKLGPGEAAKRIESVGGDMNAATSFDYTVYYTEVPDKDWSLGLDTITDMALHARIDPKELASEKQVVLSELARGEDTPGSRLFESFQGMLFKGTSYEWPIIGFRDTVSKITDADIHRYVAEHYQPQSMFLCVVGKVDPQAVLARAEAVFGGMTNTTAEVEAQPFAPRDIHGPQVTLVPGKWNKVYLGVAFPLPDQNSAQVPGLELLAQLLGGDETSRLYREFKYERRLVDEIDCQAMTLARGGFLYISATLDSDKVEPFWKALAASLAGLDPGSFTDEELARAKLNLENSLLLTKETLSGLASKLGYFQFQGGGLRGEEIYLRALADTGRDQLKELARDYLRPDRMTAALLVPEGSTLTAESLEQAARKTWPAPAKASAQADAAAAKQEIVDLPGGSKLVLLPDPTLPYASLSLAWPGGDSLADAEHQGLPALAARVLTRGTKKRNATRIEDFLSDRAAELSASAGRGVFSVSAKYPSRFSEDILGLLREILTSPTWPAKELALAKQDQAARIHRGEDQPIGLLFRNVHPFLFASGPYSYFQLGKPEQFDAFTVQDLRRFWAGQSREPFVLALCGQFDAERVREFAATLAKSLEGQAPAVDTTAPRWGEAREKALHLPGRNQAHLLAVFPAPGRDDLETGAGLSVLRAALAGQSGLLFRDLRDKQGLGYTVTAFLWQAPKAGFMAFYIGTEPEKLDQARQGFHTVVEALRAAPLPAEEVERARNILTGEYYQEHQSLSSRSGEAAGLMVQGYDLDRERKLIQAAQSVTPEQLRDLARRWLDWSKAYEMRVEP
ncbi:insulinase family protein [Desulfovibrio aminophilus]|nr:pitrilysin family protein [Desulfovibrio aminophilus]MCM0756430.1 insulinase family protein [Desulfovibrio aminophilus]